MNATEKWTIKKNSIGAREMWCWRPMLRVPWSVRRTNESILNEIKLAEKLSITCHRRILEYFGNTMREEGGNLEKLVVLEKVEG